MLEVYLGNNANTNQDLLTNFDDLWCDLSLYKSV